MSRKLAIKKLKASDLSFFLPYLNRFPQAKQKGFNLDRSVVEDVLFPTLTAEVAAAPDNRAPVALTFFGPGGAPPYLLMRKVLKQQKNWRLNGEAVPNPIDDPGRFNGIAPEDIAIMEFTGTSMPNAVKVLLLSASNPTDALIHAAFATAFPTQSMAVLAEQDIERVIAAAGTSADHPIRDWLDRDLLEEVGQGDARATDLLLKKRQGRGLSAAELRKAKEAAESVGRDGEELLDFYFENFAAPDVASHQWVANTNVISPYDFQVVLADGSKRHVDAKSTRGPFSNPIHLSLNEIRHAATSGVPYDICRLYDVTETSASFRVAKDIAGRLTPILEGVAALPKGVTVDSMSFKPDYFDFGTEARNVTYPEEA
jgi:hypothetical protein